MEARIRTALINAVLRAARNLDDQLTQIHAKLPPIPYTFEHAQADISVARFVLAGVPDPQDISGLFEATSGAEDRLTDLQRRCLGGLAVAVEEVEKALKLPALRPIEAEAVA